MSPKKDYWKDKIFKKIDVNLSIVNFIIYIRIINHQLTQSLCISQILNSGTFGNLVLIKR
jgi:hypothetical protein